MDTKGFHSLQSGTPGIATPVWRIDARHPERQTIRLAGKILSHGGVIVYPTETFYGLGADPNMPAAVERVYRIKGRAFNKPLPLIASNGEAVRRAVVKWPETAERLAQKFWPGPLTLILEAAPSLFPLVHANTGKIAVRISSHLVPQALASEIGGLLIATSANWSNEQPCRTPKDIPGEFLAKVDGLIDAGPTGETSLDLPSTMVDVSGTAPRLVRPGCIPWERVEEVLSAEC